MDSITRQYKREIEDAINGELEAFCRMYGFDHRDDTTRFIFTAAWLSGIDHARIRVVDSYRAAESILEDMEAKR